MSIGSKCCNLVAVKKGYGGNSEPYLSLDFFANGSKSNLPNIISLADAVVINRTCI